MVSICELEEYLKNFLQVDNFKDYCLNGLQVEGSRDIKKIATAVSASLEVIESAQKEGVDALIVHHGLFWNDINFSIQRSMRQKLKLLLEKDVSLFAYHLPLDAHVDCGNNWAAAKDLGWKELQPFGEVNGVEIGVVGSFAPISVEEFGEHLQKFYGHLGNFVLSGKEIASSAALISGGAYRNIADAINAKVDCFVTGNFDEPVWNIANEEKINFFAMGHHATEKIGPQKLGKHLQKKFNLDWVFIDFKNPF